MSCEYYKNGGLAIINRMLKNPADFLKWNQPNVVIMGLTQFFINSCRNYQNMDALSPFRKQLLTATFAAKNKKDCLLPINPKAYSFNQLLALDCCNYLIYNTIIG